MSSRNSSSAAISNDDPPPLFLSSFLSLLSGIQSVGFARAAARCMQDLHCRRPLVAGNRRIVSVTVTGTGRATASLLAVGKQPQHYQ